MEHKIVLANENILLSREYKMSLAQRLIQMELSRMKTADWLYETLNNYEGTIYINRNYILRVHDDLIELAFGNDEAFTYATDIKRFADRMPERRTSRSQLLRLHVFDAAFKILGKQDYV